jgi:hypothetical protein
MLAEAVTPKVERDHPQIVEERDDAQPVAVVAGQPVEEDDRRSPAVIAEGKPLRGAILRDRFPAIWPPRPPPGWIFTTGQSAGSVREVEGESTLILTDEQSRLFREPNFAVVTTLKADGMPQTSVVWVDEEDPRFQDRVIVRVTPCRIHDYLDGPPPDPASAG